jgi:glutathione S-transferase
MGEATLLISSRNYSSWSLRGWLLARLSGLSFKVELTDPNDPNAKAELLLRTSTIRVPSLLHDGILVWDTLAIAEYLNELFPQAGMMPTDRIARAHCRSISGEMHSGFAALRASLPMNLRSRRPGFKIWSAPQADIDFLLAIWRECISRYGGPWLFGDKPTIADAMYAPVATRFLTYEVKLDPVPLAYRDHILAWAPMQEWIAAAMDEPEMMIDELEVEF